MNWEITRIFAFSTAAFLAGVALVVACGDTVPANGQNPAAVEWIQKDLPCEDIVGPNPPETTEQAIAWPELDADRVVSVTYLGRLANNPQTVSPSLVGAWTTRIESAFIADGEIRFGGSCDTNRFATVRVTVGMRQTG